MTQQFYSQVFTQEKGKHIMSTQSKDLFKSGQSNLIHNSPQLERTQMSMDERMNKQIVVHSYNETTLSYKTKQTTKTKNNMGDPQNHYAEPNETDTDHTYCLILLV